MTMTYGTCGCGGPLKPKWFREHEKDAAGRETGRTRKACSCLVCDWCGRNHTVDDSFDGPWESPSIR